MIRKLKVLVIEDEPSHRLMISANLGYEGYECDAVDQYEGWARLFNPLYNTRYRYDCVIVDIHMPGKDGYDFLAERNRTRKHLPMVATCADNYESLTAISHGADEFLYKPYTSESVRETVNKAINNRKKVRSG